MLPLLPILLNPLHDVDEMGDIGKHEDRQADESHHVDLANPIDKISYHYETGQQALSKVLLFSTRREVRSSSASRLPVRYHHHPAVATCSAFVNEN